MTKGEIRKARKEARAAGIPLTGELAIRSEDQHLRNGVVIPVIKPTPTQMRSIARKANPKQRFASRAEQHARYIDCGPANWDN